MLMSIKVNNHPPFCVERKRKTAQNLVISENYLYEFLPCTFIIFAICKLHSKLYRFGNVTFGQFLIANLCFILKLIEL